MIKRNRNKACLRQVLSIFLISLTFLQGMMGLFGLISTAYTDNESPQDVLKPEVYEIHVIPDPQEIYNYLNISYEMDDETELDTTWIIITYPDTSTQNVTPVIIEEEIDYYFCYENATYPQAGNYSFVIWANDTSNNINNTEGGTFNITDTSLPEVYEIHAIPDPQEAGDYLNISYEVDDNFEVDTSWLIITYPDTSTDNATPVQIIDSPDYHIYYENTTYTQVGNYTFVIWANDTSGNINNTETGTFNITDTTLPEIANVTAIPYETERDFGIVVNITADITDITGVDIAYVNITHPDDGYNNFTMNQGTGNEWYYQWHPTDHNNNSYIGLNNYTIWANDTNDNWNSSTVHDFWINDTNPMEIDDIKFNGVIWAVTHHINQGEYANISSTFSNGDFNGAWLNITYPDSSTNNYSMLNITDGYGWYNQSYTIAGNHTAIIWINDTNNNWNNTGYRWFFINELDPGSGAGGGGGTGSIRFIDFEYWVRGKVVQFNYTGNLGDETRFRWNFGDGTGSDDIDERVVNRYSDYGNYTVTLEVWNNQGRYMMIQKEIQIPHMFINLDDNTATIGPLTLFIPIWFFSGIFLIFAGANGWHSNKIEREAIIILGILLTTIGFIFLANHYGWLDSLI